MPTSLNSAASATDIGYSVVQTLRRRITYLDRGLTLTVGKIPPGATVVGGGVHIVTGFNGSGTDLLDVGYIGSTTVANSYGTLLELANVGYIVLDELAATTNIQGTVEHTVTCKYTDQNSNATAGAADLIVQFVSAYPAA